MREYRIKFKNNPPWADYPVDAKDAIDARVMGEFWAKRWKMEIESITDITKEPTL
jgi:hypothetical protein